MLKSISIILSTLLCGGLFAQGTPTRYISPTSNSGRPSMPNLDFNLDDYPVRGGFIVESTAEHKKRGHADDLKFSTSASSGILDINKQSQYKIFGGEVALKSAADGKVLSKVKVRGKNPSDNDARNFIKSHCGIHWYAYAIARHESRQRYYVFNQFNSSYYKEKVRGIPNCGLPDGWGIMQIDSKRGFRITTGEVYDWQENVKSGIAVMDKARKEAIAYFEAVKRTYPDKWENPPAYIKLNGTNTRLSYLDACVIQLYNGASVVRRLKTPYGTYSFYRSAFVFDENADSGCKWKFKPNVNSYVFKVVNHEIEGKLKIENEK